jgi:cell division protein FtsA
MRKNYICALDIGSSKISGALAEIRKAKIVDLYLESLPSKGVKKGSIVDSIELVEVIGKLLKNLKGISGINIKSVQANISGTDITTKHSHAIIPLTERGNKLITTTDIDKVNEQAKILGSDIDDEIIHKIPSSYAVDSKSGILNPLELYGHKLEVDLYLICARLSCVQTIIHVINQAGFEGKELCFSGLATSEAVFDAELKKGTNVICDIGADITELLLFREGELRNIRILDMGGQDLTRAISESLNIPMDLAEEIKVAYANIAETGLISEDKEVLIKKDSTYKPIKQRQISEIVTKKAKSMSEVIKENVEKNTNLLDINNFILTGRTILQEGFLEMLEETLGIKSRFGRILHPALAAFTKNKTDLSGRKYMTYITALGLLTRQLASLQPKPESFTQPSDNPILRFFHQAKEIYQEYF